MHTWREYFTAWNGVAILQKNDIFLAGSIAWIGAIPLWITSMDWCRRRFFSVGQSCTSNCCAFIPQGLDGKSSAQHSGAWHRHVHCSAYELLHTCRMLNRKWLTADSHTTEHGHSGNLDGCCATPACLCDTHQAYWKSHGLIAAYKLCLHWNSQVICNRAFNQIHLVPATCATPCAHLPIDD